MLHTSIYSSITLGKTKESFRTIRRMKKEALLLFSIQRLFMLMIPMARVSRRTRRGRKKRRRRGRRRRKRDSGWHHQTSLTISRLAKKALRVIYTLYFIWFGTWRKQIWKMISSLILYRCLAEKERYSEGRRPSSSQGDFGAVATWVLCNFWY